MVVIKRMLRRMLKYFHILFSLLFFNIYKITDFSISCNAIIFIFLSLSLLPVCARKHTFEIVNRTHTFHVVRFSAPHMPFHCSAPLGITGVRIYSFPHPKSPDQYLVQLKNYWESLRQLYKCHYLSPAIDIIF